MIDLDYWMELYRQNPEEFEEQRKLFLDYQATVIAKNDMQLFKLQALQARINIARKGNSPMNATIIISDMMWTSFEELNKLLQEAKK